MPTKIEWCTEVWNPLAGCTRVSPGCQHCYAERMAKRQIAMGNKNYAGTVDKHGRWTGKINLIPDALEKPQHWRKPRRIFVNSMSDLFHENVGIDFILQVFAVMAACPQHTFQVLTKRSERMMRSMQCLDQDDFWSYVDDKGGNCDVGLPLPNVDLGVSVENQETANERIPWLLKTPAAVRWVSAEPLLGPVDFTKISWAFREGAVVRGTVLGPDPQNFSPRTWIGVGIDGIVVGGESGPGARPMDPDWARSVRDQCQEAGVAYFFKQWGAWKPCDAPLPNGFTVNSSRVHEWHCGAEGLPGERFSINVGKKAAGRILDGRTWDDLPGIAQGE